MTWTLLAALFCIHILANLSPTTARLETHSKLSANRTFVIDFANDRFLKDGQPFRYISGSVHYFRMPRYYWRDRLAKIRAAGLNAIEFYVPWNFHEPFPGKYDFRGDADLEAFLDLANQLGLVVILRLGPYVCGEWENGGLPWWLIKTKDIRMRTKDERFLAQVDKWYTVLMPKIIPRLYKNGGPIILVQVENEYGSFKGCDVAYTAHLRDLFRSYFGYDTQLISEMQNTFARNLVDGCSLAYLKCGFIPDVYPTVDFGVDSKCGVEEAFASQRVYAPRGPLINSEFYPGWLDNWGLNFSRVATKGIIETMTTMYGMGASFNFYMFHGGTNFAYWNGAESKAVITSYDYDAPLNEAGDPTPKYFAIRSAIANLTGITPPIIPPATVKRSFGRVSMYPLGTVAHLLDALSPIPSRIYSQFPLTMEQIDHPYGFVLYETVLHVEGSLLSAPGVRDRGFVLVDGLAQGTLVPREDASNVSISANLGSKLQILVENRGRQTYETINDFKGIVENVTLDGSTLTGWIMCPINLEGLSHALKSKTHGWVKTMAKAVVPGTQRSAFPPTIYQGRFNAHQTADTFFDPTGWGKGQLLVNSVNLGRYWPSRGPQVTLFVPKPYLQKTNQVLLLELEQPGNCDFDGTQCSVRFTDRPFLNQTVIDG